MVIGFFVRLSCLWRTVDSAVACHCFTESTPPLLLLLFSILNLSFLQTWFYRDLIFLKFLLIRSVFQLRFNFNICYIKGCGHCACSEICFSIDRPTTVSEALLHRDVIQLISCHIAAICKTKLQLQSNRREL